MNPADWQPTYARRAERMKASEIRELLKLLDRPGIISFAGGIPDPELFPAEAVGGARGRTNAQRGEPEYRPARKLSGHR